MRFLCKHLPCGIVNFLLQTSLRVKIQLPAKCGSWVAGDKLEMSQQHALAARQALGLHWRSSARRLREEISLIILRRDTASSLEPPDSRKTSTNWGKSSRGHRASSVWGQSAGRRVGGAGQAPSLEAFKNRLEGVLHSLSWPYLAAGPALSRRSAERPPEVPCNPYGPINAVCARNFVTQTV